MPDEGQSPSIAERIANGPSGIDDALGTHDEGGSVEPVEQPKPLDTAAVDALLQEKLKPLEDQLAESKMEVAYLRGAQAEQSRQPRTVVQQPATEKPKTYLESTPEAQVLEGLEKKPIETLARIIDDRLRPILDRLDNVGGTVVRSQREQEFQRILQQDATELNEDFGHLQNSVEFKAEADANYQGMLRANNGQYLPGMLHKASSRAFAKMVREGRLSSSTATNGNGGATTTPSRVFRNGNSHGAESSSGAGGGEGGSGGDPKSIADLQASGVISATDAAAAKRVMSRIGVSEADYVRRFNNERKQNPRFGER